MEFGVGSIVEGKVTGITKFGAFVSLPEGKSGLVHISEIAYSYVNEVSDFLKEALLPHHRRCFEDHGTGCSGLYLYRS